MFIKNYIYKNIVNSLFLSLIIIVAISCNSNNKNILNVKLSKIDSGTAYLVSANMNNKNKPIIDTIKFTNGKFTITKNNLNPLIYQLVVAGFQESINFFLAPGITEIDITDSLIKNYKIKGVKEQNEFEEYTTKLSAILRSYDTINYTYQLLQQSHKQKIEDEQKINNLIEELKNKKSNLDSVCINKYNNSVMSTYILLINLLSQQYTTDKVLVEFEKLPTNIKKSYYGKQILEIIEETPRVGFIAKNFTQNDVNNTKVSLSDYKGKYLILDFWASWCGPCRKSNPHLVKVYEKYNKLGLEILGVSLDTDKANWLKAIKDDNLTWKHVSDLNGWDNVAAKLYNVSGIPATYLLDKENKIMAINPTEEELIKALDSIFIK